MSINRNRCSWLIALYRKCCSWLNALCGLCLVALSARGEDRSITPQESDGSRSETNDGAQYSKDGTILLAGPKEVKSFTIPSSVTEIGRGAFLFCRSLESITIPSSVTKIGEKAFYYCGSVGSITIPSSVTEIGFQAFGGCGSLSSITIPSSVKKIGIEAFHGCNALASIEVASDNTKYCSIDGVLYSKDRKVLVSCPGGRTSLTIPSSVTEIGESAFFNCGSLASITIPPSVKKIGEMAFDDCTELTIIAKRGSTAWKYAKKNKIPVQEPEKQ